MAYTFLDLAHEILKAAPHPLTYQEIWETAKANGAATKVRTKGKTPWQSLGAYLYVDVRDNEVSRFVKVGKTIMIATSLHKWVCRTERPPMPRR